MATRPNFIDVRSQSHGPLGNPLPSPRSQLSPRLHVAGDVPPDLSPLDAFAAQSRLLAKQLEFGSNDGKRMSRLPPLAVENALYDSRPSFFRSVSLHGPRDTEPLRSPTGSLGMQTQLEVPTVRPVSQHPQLGTLPPPRTKLGPSQLDIPEEEESRGRQLPEPVLNFGTRREESPGPINTFRSKREDASPSYFPAKPSIESMRQHGQSPRRRPESRGYDTRLAPPRSPFAQKTPSVRSSVEDSDEDLSASVGTSFLSTHRKFSGAGGMSTSPTSFAHSLVRSTSESSDISAGGSRLSRPTFNFSRPLSRASEFTSDLPLRQASSDSQPYLMEDDTPHTPLSMHGEDFRGPSPVPGASSYVYSRFSLPRGKMLQRNSRILQETMPTAEFRWEQSIPESNVQTYKAYNPDLASNTTNTPSTSHLGQVSVNEPQGGPSDHPPYEQHLTHQGDSQSDEARSPYPAGEQKPQTTPSITSSSTVKARSQHSVTPSVEDTADDHVTKGIECHENGSLKESTYHLRIAARQNHPTGMLLYALACRHGWGMRPNQREGVQWLRKAAEFAILEVADDEGQLKEGKAVDFIDQKTRKAQFALSIYELGVSHMNGWGIEQDKVLALRCFEIAGAWGDGDALAEAGFCYTQGLGCKKDLQKAARFYRQAESKGISMIGNSWIYKSKYQGEPSTSSDSPLAKIPTSSPEKGTRSKSRTRSMFRRNKANTT